jgi:hypothetical protein
MMQTEAKRKDNSRIIDSQVTETKQSSGVQEKMKKQRYSYSKQMQHWEVR